MLTQAERWSGDSRAEGVAPARGCQAAAQAEPSWELACEVGGAAGAPVTLARRGGVVTPKGKGRPLGRGPTACWRPFRFTPSPPPPQNPPPGYPEGGATAPLGPC